MIFISSPFTSIAFMLCLYNDHTVSKRITFSHIKKMNDHLLQHLICPICLPTEIALDCTVRDKQDTDIISATLHCSGCNSTFPIDDGVAFLDPAKTELENPTENKYEQDTVVSSYLWSHYGDLLGDENWSDAYPHWSRQIQTTSGLGLDLGAAVGRFTFELAGKCDFAVGLDNSLAFIDTARKLMQNKKINVQLKEEGHLCRTETIHIPDSWQRENMDFIVADALRLPFRTDAASITTSLNLIDKLPHPLQHLQEMNRVSQQEDAQCLLSDPFSWSEEAAAADEWLGGKKEGDFTGFGLDTVQEIFTRGTHNIMPPWQEEARSHVWWKIRTHRNHYELIRSCYLKAKR